jgi:hypothetical protein
VFAIKHEDGREGYKARLCLGGHRDFLKHHMVHTASTLTMTSVRLILAIAAIFCWNIWTTDVQQAYLQSVSLLKKEVFLKTNAIELGTNEFLQLSLPLCGLSESGDYWARHLIIIICITYDLLSLVLTFLCFSRFMALALSA